MSKKTNVYVGSEGNFVCTDNLEWRTYNSQLCSNGEDFILMSSNEIRDVLQRTEGRLLTIIESVITNPVQLEATKSLIRNSVRETYSDLWVSFLTMEQVKKI